MKILLLILIKITLFANSFKEHLIEDYRVENIDIKLENRDFKLIRSFLKDRVKNYLVVDQNSLKTKVLSTEKFKIIETTKNSRYENLVNKYSKEPFLLENYGLKGIENSKKIYLTADLCPSSKVGFEDRFFENLGNYYKDNAFEITLFISGRWIDKHKTEFYKLLDYQKKYKLNITFGNHSLTHPYYKDKPLDKNFLLSNIDLNNEVLELEKKLLSFDVTPSILFRFPGLISDKKSVKKLKEFGYIIVGSNAWLAKNEKIHDGSIILVHGNKNEPLGIEIFNKIIEKNRALEFGSILNDL